MKTTPLKLTLIANFIALGVALGYALALIPNVELVTFTIFLGGYSMGWREGAFIGLVTEFIYSNFNIYGPAPFHVLTGQIIGMMLAGIAGGLMRFVVQPAPMRLWGRLLLATTGILVTMCFDFLTTIGDVILADGHMDFFIARIVQGAPYYIIHPIANGLIFFFLLPLTAGVIEKLPPFKSYKSQILQGR